MEKQIRELRVSLDKLATLTKSLKPVCRIIFDMAALPDNVSLEDFMHQWNNSPISIVDTKGDENIKSIQTVNTNEYDFIKKSFDSIQLSKMWLGKVLKEIGTVNPYPESKNPESDKIEPTADVAKNLTVDVNGGWEEMTHIQRVKWLRNELEKVEIYLDINKYPHFLPNPCNGGLIAWSNAYVHCLEAGMWLGMELGRIKQVEDENRDKELKGSI